MRNARSVDRTRMVVHLALLVALEIVLNRFVSINTWNVKIGFSWLPMAMAAWLYGPVWGGLSWAMADFLGANLFPIMPYHPGFTLTALIAGAIYGAFLHRRQVTLVRVILAVVLVALVNLSVNTIWILQLYGEGMWAALPGRFIQAGVLLPVQIICIWTMSAGKSPVGRMLMRAA